MRLSHARACADGVEAPGTQALKAHVKLDQATWDRLYQRLSSLKLVEAVDEVARHVADLHGVYQFSPTHGFRRETDRLSVDVRGRKFLIPCRLGNRLCRLVEETVVSSVLNPCQDIVLVAVYRLADELIHEDLGLDRANILAKDAVYVLTDHPPVTITALDHGIEDGASVFTGKQAATTAPLQVVESSPVIENQRQHAHLDRKSTRLNSSHV